MSQTTLTLRVSNPLHPGMRTGVTPVKRNLLSTREEVWWTSGRDGDGIDDTQVNGRKMESAAPHQRHVNHGGVCGQRTNSTKTTNTQRAPRPPPAAHGFDLRPREGVVSTQSPVVRVDLTLTREGGAGVR